MELFEWHNGEVENNLKVKQVYGICFLLDGRIMLKVENKGTKKVYSLAGGKPEKCDKDRVDTLKREYIEEVNTTIKDIHMCGYQQVNESGELPPYAQVRMVGLIDKIGPKLPDPDRINTIYDRLLTTPEKAKQYLNWGQVGDQMIDQSVTLAAKYFNITTFNDCDEYV